MPNVVSVTRPSLQILSKTQTQVFPISRFQVNPFIKENCHNSRANNDINMKLRLLTKLDKRNKTKSKKLTLKSLSFFRLLANLEQSGGQIPDTESAKVMFSVIVTFCLTKTENRTKKSLTQLSHYCFE